MLSRRQAAKSGILPPRSPLFLSIALFIITWGIFGGARSSDVPTFALLSLAGSLLLGVVIASGALLTWRHLAWAPKLLIIFTVLMPVLQILPLPPGVAQSLPGRVVPNAILASVGLGESWRPITLNVVATFQSLLTFVWLAGLLFGLLRLTSDELRWTFGLVAALGMLNIMIGVVQVASGGRALHMHESLHTGFLLGVFANKNHTALFLAMSILAGFVARYGKTGWQRRDFLLSVPVTIVLAGALIATFSRAGLVLGALAFGYVLWLSFGGRLQRATGYGVIGAGALLAISGAAIITTSVAGRSLDRFSGVGQDLRWSIWPWSWPLVKQYFPFGAGIGSFKYVFEASEKLDWVKPTYVNNVHNEYIEQLIEVGIAAPIFWLLVVVALVTCLPSAWVLRHRQSGQMALIGAAMIALFMLHSIVDYPLRRPALAMVCILAAAAMFRITAIRKAIA